MLAFLRQLSRRAMLFDLAGFTLRTACAALLSAMPDEPVTQNGPMVSWNELDEVYFDFLWGGGLAKSEPEGQALDVGVHDDTFIPAIGIS